MSEQAELAVDTGAPDHARLRKHEADFTPLPIVRQGMGWIAANYRAPRRYLDPCAGPGPFGVVAGEVWPKARRVGVEIRVEELPYLEHNYDRQVIGDWKEYIARATEAYDLVGTNPAFTEFVPLVDHFINGDGLTRRGLLVLFGLSDVMQRAEGKVEFLLENPPTLELAVAGPIRFRGPGINPETGKKHGADTRSYSWWVYDMADRNRGDRWPRVQLPWLPAAQRKWLVRPGTEVA